ncbi:MAG: phage gp6-like head-tail connector protein [Sedimentisphaerales bacterium]|nr:phage gp6-like head-tail connector protein [Sedimentisphaerales bacterium]
MLKLETQKYIISAVTNYPVSLSEVKEHLRIIGNDEDNVLSLYLKTAIDYCENFEGSCLTEKNVTAYYPYFLAYMALPLSPAVLISSVKYNDGSGNLVLYNGEKRLDSVANPSYIYFPESLPVVSTDYPNSVEISYITGRGERMIEDRIKQAILLLVGHYYENREATSSAALNAIPFAVSALLYKRNF